MLTRAYSTLEIKAVGDAGGKRRFTGVASTISTDRMNDIVMPRGMRAKLPVPCLWQHDAREPIGWVISTRVSDTEIEADFEVGVLAADFESECALRGFVLREGDPEFGVGLGEALHF